MKTNTLASRTAQGFILGNSGIRTFSRDQILINERRLQIVQGATKLFVKQGFDRTNIREVAQACNLSRGSLYHYIGSKRDILSMIIGYATLEQAECIENVFNMLQDANPTQALLKLIETLYKWHDTHQDICIFVYQETRNLPQKDRQRIFDAEGRMVSAFEKLLRKGIDSGAFRISNPKLVAHNIVFLAHGWALRRWFLRKHVTVEEYVKNQIEYILKGIGGRDAHNR